MGPFDHTIDVSLYYPCGAHEMSPLQSIKTIGDENMEQRKFKVGDKVVAKGFTSSMDGKHGKIKSYDGTDWRPYEVEFEDGQTFMLYDTEMELLKEEKEMTALRRINNMAKYKVGDKVRVKGHRVDVGPGWVDSMNHMMGKIATISKISDMGYYRIEEEAYWWCDDMFEGLVESVDNSLESTGNEIIDLLMKKLDVKIDEEFEIDKAVGALHFKKDGRLLDDHENERTIALSWLVLGNYSHIKKIPKPKEMTMQELEKALGHPVKIVKGDK